MITNNTTFYQIRVSYEEKLLKRRSEPQSVSITTRDFFTKYYPRLYDWDWDSYFADRKGFYNRFPNPLTGKLWYKGPIDFMDACYLRIGMVACVSEKVKNILFQLHVNEEEYVLHPISISNEDAPYYVLFVPFLTVDELKIDYSYTVFDTALWPNETLISFKDKNDISAYLLEKDNQLLAKKLVLDKSLSERDIINAGYIHGFIHFSERIINAFEKNNVVGYQVLQPGREGTAPLLFSDFV